MKLICLMQNYYILNKIFKSKNLTENNKVKVLTSFDKADTVKEAKLIYETLKDGLD